MVEVLLKVLFCVLAYLIGSIPFGFIIGKIKGVDIRNEGSKNIGATNVGRIFGKKYALLTYFLDMLKGFLLVFLFNFKILPTDWCVLNPMLYGFLANLGHCFPIYLKFKGGKSVSCGSGAIGGYCPLLFVTVIIVFFVTKKLSKLVSFGSLVSVIYAVVASVILSLAFHEFRFIDIHTYEFSLGLFSFGGPLDLWYLLFVFLIGTLIYLKHIPNIKRILKHEEKPANY